MLKANRYAVVLADFVFGHIYWIVWFGIDGGGMGHGLSLANAISLFLAPSFNSRCAPSPLHRFLPEGHLGLHLCQLSSTVNHPFPCKTWRPGDCGMCNRGIYDE